MNPENKKVVLFDFDGVLVNTAQFCYEIHQTKNKDFTLERLISFSDGNFLDGYFNAVENEGHVEVPDFYDQYDQRISKLHIPDILHNAVTTLASAYILVIVSSTHSSVIHKFLKKENIDECFAEIYGHENHWSKIVKIKSILDKYNIEPEDTVFVTDTLGDIKEAHECGVKSIAVTWGYHDKERLNKGNPLIIIDDPRDLASTVEDMVK
jgi:phosphoglycolate phosphatase